MQSHSKTSEKQNRFHFVMVMLTFFLGMFSGVGLEHYREDLGLNLSAYIALAGLALTSLSLGAGLAVCKIDSWKKIQVFSEKFDFLRVSVHCLSGALATIVIVNWISYLSSF